MAGRNSGSGSRCRGRGGIFPRAAAIYSRHRRLAIISESEWSAAVDAAARFGIVARIDRAVEFASQSRVLLLRHQETAVDIDVILGGLPFEEDTVLNGKHYVVGGVRIRLPKVEDLVIMKAVAHRPRDMQDIEGLLQAHADLDLRSVRQWVREFASVTAMSDVIDDFDKLLARLNRTPPT